MDSFTIIEERAFKEGWSPESEIVLLCHFLDQLHAKLPGTEDDGILGDFDRFLAYQAEVEHSYNLEVYIKDGNPNLDSE